MNQLYHELRSDYSAIANEHNLIENFYPELILKNSKWLELHNDAHQSYHLSSRM
jgi:hypothetical protein